MQMHCVHRASSIALLATHAMSISAECIVPVLQKCMGCRNAQNRGRLMLHVCLIQPRSHKCTLLTLVWLDGSHRASRI